MPASSPIPASTSTFDASHEHGLQRVAKNQTGAARDALEAEGTLSRFGGGNPRTPEEREAAIEAEGARRRQAAIDAEADRASRRGQSVEEYRAGSAERKARTHGWLGSRYPGPGRE